MTQPEPGARERYRQIVENLRTLPSLPSVVMKLVEVVNSPDTSADDAAQLIEKDPALTSAVLRLANSAFYGMPRSVSSVASAVVILGFNTIRSIVLSASIMKAFPPGRSTTLFDHNRFWQHTILCACGAKIVARECMHSLSLDPEAAFCAGILHDIGKLIFEQCVPEEFDRACQYAVANAVSLYEAERHVMGVTHADIGTIIADKWALPIDLESALVYHHSPELTERANALVTTIHCADHLAHVVGADLWENEVIQPLWEQTNTTLEFNDAMYDDCLEQTRQSVNSSVAFLSMIS